MESHIVIGANTGGLFIRAMVKTIRPIGVVVRDIHINSPFLNFNLKMGAGLFQPRRLPHPAVILLDEMSLEEPEHIGVSFSRAEDFILAEAINQKRYDFVVSVAFNDCDHCVIPNAQAGSAENGVKIIGLNDFTACAICGVVHSVECHMYFPFHMLVKRVIKARLTVPF